MCRPEARAGYIAGAGATKDQLEEIVADESLGLIDHTGLFAEPSTKGLAQPQRCWETAIRLALLAGRLHENSGIAGD